MLMFGTNDSKRKLWNKDIFVNDYIDFIGTFENSTIFIMVPPPLYKSYGSMNPDVVNE